MKLTTSLISAVALHAAAAVAQASSDYNVEGNLFTIVVNKVLPNATKVDEVAVTTFGDKGTDGSLIIWNGDDNDPTQKRTSFYINKNDQSLVAVNPWWPQLFATAYTDQPEGGEIKFTYRKDDDKEFYLPKFSLGGELLDLYVNGKPDLFYLCTSNTTTRAVTLLEGSLSVGKVAGKNCQKLDATLIYPLDSNLY